VVYYEPAAVKPVLEPKKAEEKVEIKPEPTVVNEPVSDVMAALQTEAAMNTQRDIQAAVEAEAQAQAQAQEALKTKSDVLTKTAQAAVKEDRAWLEPAATPQKSEKEIEVNSDDEIMEMPELDEGED